MPLRQRTPVFERIALGVLIALVLWAPFPLGSNPGWAWGLLEAGLFAAGICWLAAWWRNEVRVPDALRAAWPALVVLTAWLAYLTLHWVPLPAGWVEVLSPQAGRHYASLVGLGGSADGPVQGQAWLSVDPRASFSFWLISCAWATAFVLTLALCRTRERLRLLAYVLVLSGLVQAVYGGMLHLAGENLVMFGTQVPHASYAAGGFVNRNHLAGFLEITLAVGIGLLIADLEDSVPRSWRRFVRDAAALVLSRKAPLRIFLIVMVVALVMTRSRMGNTAFFASLLAAGVIALVLSRHASRSTMILVASLIVVDIFIVGAWFGVEKTVQRIEQTTQKDVEERVDPGREALAIHDDFPLFGTGAGTFYITFSAYRSPDISAYFDYAHNDYVQFLDETGLVGLGLVGLFALMPLGAALLAQARRRDPLARGMGFAVVMGVVSIGIHSSVDFNLQIPANALVFMILLAFGWLSLSLGRSAPRAAAGPEIDQKAYDRASA